MTQNILTEPLYGKRAVIACQTTSAFVFRVHVVSASALWRYLFRSTDTNEKNNKW